jgi:osmotically-inducible protein OsmY
MRKSIMKMLRITLAATSVAMGLALTLSAPVDATDPATTREASESAPDNSGRNVRDRSGDTLTPMEQSNEKSDVELTRKIREEVVGDDSLSMLAHNVKIISIDGIVTLRGPVKTEGEKERVASLAEKTAGAGKVRNHLEVTR